MLKIKDNVDLKELEKYGFVKGNIGYKKEIEYTFDSLLYKSIKNITNQ